MVAKHHFHVKLQVKAIINLCNSQTRWTIIRQRSNINITAHTAPAWKLAFFKPFAMKQKEASELPQIYAKALIPYTLLQVHQVLQSQVTLWMERGVASKAASLDIQARLCPLHCVHFLWIVSLNLHQLFLGWSLHGTRFGAPSNHPLLPEPTRYKASPNNHSTWQVKAKQISAW